MRIQINDEQFIQAGKESVTVAEIRVEGRIPESHDVFLVPSPGAAGVKMPEDATLIVEDDELTVFRTSKSRTRDVS